MDKVHAESMVHIMIEDACNLCVKGMNSKVEELRSSVERIVNTYDLDEHFIDEFDMDVEDVKERQNQKRELNLIAMGRAEIFFIFSDYVRQHSKMHLYSNQSLRMLKRRTIRVLWLKFESISTWSILQENTNE